MADAARTSAGSPRSSPQRDADVPRTPLEPQDQSPKQTATEEAPQVDEVQTDPIPTQDTQADPLPEETNRPSTEDTASAGSGSAARDVGSDGPDLTRPIDAQPIRIDTSMVTLLFCSSSFCRVLLFLTPIVTPFP